MTPDPGSVRAVIGIPLYGAGRHLEEAVSSLLGQTHEAVAYVFVDDAADDGSVRALIDRHRPPDRPVTYERNARHLGLVGNWRRTFEVAMAEHPQAEFFAWGSDHDVWDSDWLGRLVRALDSSPEAVLAYPRADRIEEDGRLSERPPHGFETRGVTDPRTRVRAVAGTKGAGNMVYGLFRVQALHRAGVFRRTLQPDRLLLAEVSLQGELHQVPEVLWQRRRTGAPSPARQRAALFPEGPPIWAYLPGWMTHAVVLPWAILAGGGGPPSVTSGERVAMARAGARGFIEWAARRRLRRSRWSFARALSRLYWSMRRRPRGAVVLTMLRKLFVRRRDWAADGAGGQRSSG